MKWDWQLLRPKLWASLKALTWPQRVRNSVAHFPDWRRCGRGFESSRQQSFLGGWEMTCWRWEITMKLEYQWNLIHLPRNSLLVILSFIKINNSGNLLFSSFSPLHLVHRSRFCILTTAARDRRNERSRNSAWLSQPTFSCGNEWVNAARVKAKNTAVTH